jgi:2-polyprenyl-3-methyl-5-hydroxy-6-metoxy-1,4-benzoquinol methylase
MQEVDDESYFNAYADLDVHELMLRDTARNAAFRAAIESVCRGKVVLDVGAGTGLLSLYAARAGALRVYAVEASGLATLLPDVVAANGFENVISVLHGRAEEVELPEQVDVLVSEWVGFHLLHESMLDSVVSARARWLKPDGLMLPSEARVFAAPVNMDAWATEHFQFWTSVDGFDLSAFVPHVAAAAVQEPLVTLVEASQLLAPPCRAASIDCATVSIGELSETGGLCRFRASRSGIVHGYALWFELTFPGCDAVLSNAPGQPPTHWKQTVVLLPEMLMATAEVTTLDCSLVLRKDRLLPRACEIELEVLGQDD